MTVAHLVIILMAIGIGLWALNTYIPMDAKIKALINIVVVAAVVVWLLQLFKIIPPILPLPLW